MPIGQYYVKETKGAWSVTSARLRAALADIDADVTGPMKVVTSNLRGVMNHSNCADLHRTYQDLNTAICHDMIAASLDSVKIVGALAVLTWLLSLLFCCIYAHTGGTRKKVGEFGDSSSEEVESFLSSGSGSEDSGDGAAPNAAAAGAGYAGRFSTYGVRYPDSV